LVFNYLIVLDY